MAKYARIIYGSNPAVNQNFCNLGDYFQTFAVDNLYRRMGIPPEDIIDIPRHGLREYDGEPVILPLQGWFGHNVKGAELFPLSPRITPVFVGFHCLSRNVADAGTLKKYEPIGCRDEATWRFLRGMGVEAYISGCLTVTLPARDPSQAGDEVLLMDADRELLPFLPEWTKGHTAELRQECYDAPGGYLEQAAYFEEKAREQYRRMSRARMIVTSRLHCAGPATAMGIPVILAKPYFDDRYTWIDLYQPLYPRSKYADIDWQRPAPDISEMKELILDNAAASILGTADAAELHARLHERYMERRRGEITVPWYRKAFVFFHEHFPQLTETLRKIMAKSNPYR